MLLMASVGVLMVAFDGDRGSWSLLLSRILGLRAQQAVFGGLAVPQEVWCILNLLSGVAAFEVFFRGRF